MRKVLFLTTLFAFALTSSVWAADVSGTWTVKMKSPMGQDESFDLAIKAAGENLTITGTHPQLQALAGTGTLKGDAITMSVKATGQMAVEIAFTGKVAGNKMSGTREIKMSGGAPGGEASSAASGGASGAPAGAPAGGQPPAGGQAPAGGQGGAPGGASGEVSNAWTADKK
jgi:hypothetical protein